MLSYIICFYTNLDVSPVHLTCARILLARQAHSYLFVLYTVVFNWESKKVRISKIHYE